MDAGHVRSSGDFFGRMTIKNCTKFTGTSKTTITCDRIDLLAKDVRHVEGVGKTKRGAVKLPIWEQPAIGVRSLI